MPRMTTLRYRPSPAGINPRKGDGCKISNTNGHRLENSSRITQKIVDFNTHWIVHWQLGHFELIWDLSLLKLQYNITGWGRAAPRRLTLTRIERPEFTDIDCKPSFVLSTIKNRDNSYQFVDESEGSITIGE